MKKFRFPLVLLIIVIMSSYSLNSFYHVGATDKNGGHYDSKKRTYHYHHGCEAHLHVEGECEFDFKNCRKEQDNYSSHSHEIEIK